MSNDETGIILNMNECPICFNEMVYDEKYITECNHEYCKACLDKWFDKGKVSCPSCRKEIKYIKHKNNEIRLVTLTQRIVRRNFVNEQDGILIRKKVYMCLFIGNFLCVVSSVINVYLGLQC